TRHTTQQRSVAAAVIAPALIALSWSHATAGAMGLPVSGFPNMNAVSLEDSTGQTYVGALDFIKVGVPSSILAYAVIITVGVMLRVRPEVESQANEMRRVRPVVNSGN
ncbi:uncharacterized protein HaLaN_18975, partial [Haematococcus lacustris]